MSSNDPTHLSPTQAFEHALRAYYAYYDCASFDVETYFKHIHAHATQCATPQDLRAFLHRATFLWTDPHLSVEPFTDTDLNVWPTSADLVVHVRDTTWPLADVRADSPADRAGLRPGWELLRINDLPVADAVSTLLHPFDHLTAPQRAYAATLLANGTRDGSTRTLTARSADGLEHTLQLDNPRHMAREVETLPPLSYQRREDHAVIRINNSLGRSETIQAFDEAIAQCLECPALVLDLRNTPSGGNTDIARSIIGHFIQHPAPYQMHEIPGIERKTTVPRRFVEYALPRSPFFPGRLLVLGGYWTGSMGEGTVIGLHAAAKAQTCTSTMGRLLGAMNSTPIPHIDAHLRLGIESLFHIDGTPREQYIADIPLPRADRDLHGNDPTTPHIRAWLSSNPTTP